MKLTKWVAAQVKSTGNYKTNILKELSEKSGISMVTVSYVERGGTMDSYRKAKQVSEATGGKVSIKDLCEV